MRVFITGGTGFIGSHVTRALKARGHEVMALVRSGTVREGRRGLPPDVRIVTGDLLDSRSLASAVALARPDVAMHLAWDVAPGGYLTSADNLRYLTGSLDLLPYLAGAGCKRLLITGTCFEHDTALGYLGEHSATRPATLYAATKHALHVVAERLAADLDVQLTWARIFYQFGPFEHPKRLVPSVIAGLLDGRAVETTPGDQIRDFLFVEDVASALVTMVERGVSGPINVGSGVPITVRSVVLRIGELLGRPDLLRLGALASPPGDPPFICANTHRLRNDVGWEPQHSLDTGLERTIEWWRGVGER